MLPHKLAMGDLDWRVSRTCDNGQCVKVARSGEIIFIGNTNSPEGLSVNAPLRSGAISLPVSN